MLALYYYDDITDQYVTISTAGAMDSPFQFSHNPDEAFTQEKKFFLRNADATKYYESVTVYLSPGALVADGNSAGWAWKMIQQDTQPHEDDWDNVASGNTITLDDIGEAGDANTDYTPMWLRGEFISGMATGNYDEISIVIDYDSEGTV